MKRTPRFATKKGRDGLWYYHLRAANGRIVMDGAEGYASKANAERAMDRAVELAIEAVASHPEL